MPDIVTAERLAGIEARHKEMLSLDGRISVMDKWIIDICAMVRNLERELAEERARLDECIAALKQYIFNPCRLWKSPNGRWQYEGTSVGSGDTERAAIDAARERNL